MKTVYLLKTRLSDSTEWGEAEEFNTRKERDEAAAQARIIGGIRTHSFEVSLGKYKPEKMRFEFNGEQTESFGNILRERDRGRDYRNDFGRASFLLTCPFCGEEDRAYVWSLAGSGKRCKGCGAMHSTVFSTVPEIVFKIIERGGE